MVHDAGDYHTAWRISEAFLKVQVLNTSNRIPEHITLNYLYDPVNSSAPTFLIPRVLYYKEYDNRYYLFISRVSGDTLEKAWLSIDEVIK